LILPVYRHVGSFHGDGDGRRILFPVEAGGWTSHQFVGSCSVIDLLRDISCIVCHITAPIHRDPWIFGLLHVADQLPGVPEITTFGRTTARQTVPSAPSF